MTDATRNKITRQMGQRARTARRFKGVSPAALAARCGLSRRRLERFEAGAAQVTADELVQIARVLELPLWFFFDVPAASSCRCVARGKTPRRRGRAGDGVEEERMKLESG